VSVWAITTPADGSAGRYVGHTSTDATGHYSLNGLDPASLAADFSDPAVVSETEFRLYFAWRPASPAEYHSPGYLNQRQHGQ
jgi:hypothetical protein